MSDELKGHIKADPKAAHGIWDMIVSNTALKSRAKFRAYVASAQNNLALNSYVKMVMDGESYDIGGNFDAVTDFRFVAPVAGFYAFTAGILLTSGGAGHLYNLALYKNGSVETLTQAAMNSDGDNIGLVISDIMRLAANDYIEVYVRSVNNSTTDITTGATNSYFAGHIISTDI